MKPEKLRDLIREVIAESYALEPRPVSFNNLTVDFPGHCVTYMGRTIAVKEDAITFPLLTTTALIMSKDSDVIR